MTQHPEDDDFARTFGRERDDPMTWGEVGFLIILGLIAALFVVAAVSIVWVVP